MLAEFQQAFADLVASPELIQRVRGNPMLLRERYDLSEREWARLVGIANHRGIEASCMLYRANRLAPLALNLPELCRALGRELRPILSEYWALHPSTDVHFLAECDRFCRFLVGKLANGYPFGPDVRPALEREFAEVTLRLEASYTERFQVSDHAGALHQPG